MKMKGLVLALLAILAGTLVFGGCEMNYGDEYDHHGEKKDKNSDTVSTVYYTINFVILGGPNVPPTQTVKYGERVTEPVVKDSKNNTYQVVWYTDQLFTKHYSFSAPVIESKTLYGEWKLDEPSPSGTEEPPCRQFD